MTNKKLIHGKWKIDSPSSYHINVPGGYLTAGWGSYKRSEPGKVENSRNYYINLRSTKNTTCPDQEIASATYDVENMDLILEINSSLKEKHGIRELLKYSSLIHMAKGIPIERKPGFETLINELEEELY